MNTTWSVKTFSTRCATPRGWPKSVRLCWHLREADTETSLAPRWVETLATAGIQTWHWSTNGAVTAPDAEIMARAIAGKFVLLTNDLDFGAIFAASRGAIPSVVQIRGDDLNSGVAWRNA